ncbi:MAG: hypothetical protein A3B74_02340 [Candidatus Kerfeldbacteria bacterium RIFCSPHIGHO2_02_FULL_42_14]|uniref:Peptidase S11 D-alanyl-D-alanine carboxypeptidase A N-terminal domain-containing protein n=1 Tax=Candidatus Kerfeldbacteria bacterium RIFCSPHIGHO2_02_FULL_42_14 TaxID=1798540 RepID=A0A1G2ARQ7_9BACT|nr:MAG: hypothetical protein A3B74_02340 [Candidatus Kerfeldbacteria bacterium RIFCSPHIGHO2_02_FULL_42_14]OGY80386.1 MAG: hypothetical protein A3E60_04960 [Candidatus Kerfeldbacteria bacterium RIFCSPHIGHO2_12_FULL_42_13]OGY83815.1 MAG: hypothetical protein A3I91_04485 [Candidatus Kerfeldbacteria bacterium RIFCSPLOWO2_02_FULL_42_19]OGY87119.1 MAG: hypothetical protein A3G01_04525 [Candidatus Kerfeldbacteria bacterium RIFCSPLOWO2_12_FULL_43_9]
MENLLLISLTILQWLTKGEVILPEFFETPTLLASDMLEYRSTTPLVNATVNQPVVVAKKVGKNLGAVISAKAAIIVDVHSGVILWQKEPDRKLPIASLTKLMTTAVFLENNPGWDQVKALEADENALAGAKFSVGNGVKLSLADLFFVTLTGSANNTALALARSTGFSDEVFVERMNEKAREFGMSNSVFKEPTGLDRENSSTVTDLARLALYVFSDARVQRATSIKEHKLKTIEPEDERTVKGTNKLLGTYLDHDPYDIVASKTGYTEEAGFCLIQETRQQEKGDVLIVILGSPTEKDKHQDMKALVDWVFREYTWQVSSSGI